MMTSNRPLEDWGKLIGDVPSATAILDRFLHHAEVLSFQGKSYRLRNQASPTTSPPEGADGGSKAAISPTGSRRKKAKKAVRRRQAKRRSLAKNNIFEEDSVPTTPAAEFRPAMAAVEPPDDMLIDTSSEAFNSK